MSSTLTEPAHSTGLHRSPAEPQVLLGLHACAEPGLCPEVAPDAGAPSLWSERVCGVNSFHETRTQDENPESDQAPDPKRCGL